MQILDTTLRDGSYMIDFAFSAAQTSQIATALEGAGVPLIEIGHGVGLNASNAGYGKAAESDYKYMEAVQGKLKTSKWGIFAIPGICTLNDLDICFECNIGFLRFGVSIDSYESAFPFIQKAKDNGVMVCVNFMKSYTKQPIVFENAARQAVKAGADYVYIVDSAGNMTPKMVRQYCERVADLQTGFHAHNNLGLAVANALVAEECGVSIIDCSLQGMGRSSGNTMTEHFVALMQRCGKLKQIDLLALCNASDHLIRPLLCNPGYDSIDLICGLAGFHSSYMPVISKLSKIYNVDPRLLIIEVCKETQAVAPESLVEEKAIHLSLQTSNLQTGEPRIPLKPYIGGEQDFI